MEYPKNVGEYTDMNKLAEDIGNLHYEQLEILLQQIAHKIKADGFKDLNKDRAKLSMTLLDASHSLSKASFFIGKAWIISKPFMKEDKKK